MSSASFIIILLLLLFIIIFRPGEHNYFFLPSNVYSKLATVRNLNILGLACFDKYILLSNPLQA